MLWRISNHEMLDGRGGLVAAARWHSQGRRIVYFAETAAGALLETLVHLELELDALPLSYKLLKTSCPDSVSVATIDEGKLSANWREDVVETRRVGDVWLSEQKQLFLRVPSAIVPETWNVLLNPLHRESKRLKVLWHRTYPWDVRLLG
jgi:RES domain-containing protein